MSVATEAAAPAASHALKLQADFSGGWNNRDAPTELAENESPTLYNMTLDERGGATKRLGLDPLGGSLPGIGRRVFYWQGEELVVLQVGAVVYKTSDFTSLTPIKTFTSDDAAGFADFHNRLVMVHPQDGVWTYTSAGGLVQTTGGTNNMDGVKGDAVTIWQNLVLVAGDKRPEFRTYVWACAPGDETTWDISATGTWVAIRDSDDAAVTALEVGHGQDVLGRPGVIVCKERGAVRIHSAETLAYTRLHNEAGASGPQAIFNLLGSTAMLNRHGIWATETDAQQEPRLVSGKIGKLFREDAIAFTALDKVCAGAFQDRIVFSLPRYVQGEGTPTENNLTLECHPADGWIVPHLFGAADFAVYEKNAARLYGVHAAEAQAFDAFVGGSDLGVEITGKYQTKWFEPAKGQKCRFRRVRVDARGTFDLRVRLDYDLGIVEPTAVSVGAGSTQGIWSSPGCVWGPPWQWGSGRFEGTVDEYSLGVGRFISFDVEETSSKSSRSRRMLDDGARFEQGVFALYGLALDYIPLGLA